SIGLTMRHGPHHGAQRSITTVGEAFASISKVDSSASTTHGSGLPHVPQCGAPRALGRIRVTAPQFVRVSRETGPRSVVVLDRWFVVIRRSRARGRSRAAYSAPRVAASVGWSGVRRGALQARLAPTQGEQDAGAPEREDRGAVIATVSPASTEMKPISG